MDQVRKCISCMFVCMRLSVQKERKEDGERKEKMQREQEQEEPGEKVSILYNEVKVVTGAKQEIIPFTIFTSEGVSRVN